MMKQGMDKHQNFVIRSARYNSMRQFSSIPSWMSSIECFVEGKCIYNQLCVLDWLPRIRGFPDILIRNVSPFYK